MFNKERQDIIVKVEPRHFAASPEGFMNSLTHQDCPLGQALIAMFPNDGIGVGYRVVNINDTLFSIPMNVWGGSSADFSSDTIDDLSKRAKVPELLHSIPTVKVILAKY